MIIGELFPPRVRAAVYLITVVAAAVYAVIEAQIDLHWGWQAAYAGWNAFAGTIAVSNIPTSPGGT